MSTIGQRIKERREELRMTQEDLGKRCGTTKQTIFKYESGIVTNIPMDRLCAIADALYISPAVLMGWEERQPAELTPDDALQLAFDARPDLRLLFSTAKDASPEDIQTAIKIISALKDKSS